MGVLNGDVNANGLVDCNDVSAVQSQRRQSVTSTNFRDDVNANGTIDGNDVSMTQSETQRRPPDIHDRTSEGRFDLVYAIARCCERDRKDLPQTRLTL